MFYKCIYKQWIVLSRKTSTTCAKFFHNTLTRVIQFVCTNRRSYTTTSLIREKTIHCLNKQLNYKINIFTGF